MSAAQQPNPVSVLDGKYALLRELGSGGTGTVYEAENLIVGKRIAIKLMNASAFAEPDSQARFVAEARAAARISHANVVDIHDLGVSREGVPYLVMELLRGETLESVIDTRGPLAPAYACELFLQILAGLSAAHAQGIVHCDLKPANVLVTHPRPDRPRPHRPRPDRPRPDRPRPDRPWWRGRWPTILRGAVVRRRPEAQPYVLRPTREPPTSMSARSPALAATPCR